MMCAIWAAYFRVKQLIISNAVLSVQVMFICSWMLLVGMENVFSSHLMQLTSLWPVCFMALTMYV